MFLFVFVLERFAIAQRHCRQRTGSIRARSQSPIDAGKIPTQQHTHNTTQQQHTTHTNTKRRQTLKVAGQPAAPAADPFMLAHAVGAFAANGHPHLKVCLFSVLF
jgi:hypothetical protein